VHGSNAGNNQKDGLIDDFINNKDTKVALLSLKSCCTGLNLTVSHTLIFAELFWTPAILE
jgi:SNF2 family DNA or RNA helicase